MSTTEQTIADQIREVANYLNAKYAERLRDKEAIDKLRHAASYAWAYMLNGGDLGEAQAVEQELRKAIEETDGLE